MNDDDTRDLQGFLPYLLNMAAEEVSTDFARVYKDRYGLLRTEWRVLFHLGQHGVMTAKSITKKAKTHKTKVSRAVAALEKKRFLRRSEDPQDRRHAWLKLTPAGQAAFEDLWAVAWRYDAKITAKFSAEEVAVLRRCLAELAN